MRHLVNLALCLACAAPLWTPAPAYGAEPPPVGSDVAAVYEVAMTAYKDGRFAEAAAGFETAYQLRPDAALLWNIGRSWEQAGELQRARDRYTEFLSHEQVDATLRLKVADALVRVGAKIQARQDAQTAEERAAQLRKEISEAEADRNAELIARLQTELEGYRASDAPRATPAPDGGANTLAQTRTARAGKPSVWSWVALGVGAAAAGVGVWLMVDAEDKRSAVKSSIANAERGFVTSMSLTEAEKFESDANRNAAIGVGTLAAGGALVATGVILAIVTKGKSAEQGLAVGAEPTRGGALFSASGRF